MAKPRTKGSDSDIITCMTRYRTESGEVRLARINQNRINFDCYNLRQDFSYKQKGQSREFLPKMSMAVEQAANFVQQGLMNIGDWFDVEPNTGVTEDSLKIKPKTIYLLLQNELQKLGFLGKISDVMKLGLVGSLMIVKVHGTYRSKPLYVPRKKLKNGTFTKILERKEQKTWGLEISLVRQEDYYPDPTGRGMYEMQDSYWDYYQLEQMATGDNPIYDINEVRKLRGSFSSTGIDKEYQKSRETGLNVTSHGFRNQIKITEIWGNILGPRGELLYENVVTTIANDTYVIQKPTPNPFWHKESPFVAVPIISVPFSPWGRALMDAPAMLNRAGNEMFNLILDGGLMSVHGIKQLNKSYLEDPQQVEDGISPGDTLLVNNSLPPGESVLSRVDTSSVPPEAMNVINFVMQELNSAALTNDLRMGSQVRGKESATAIVEASQTTSSMFSGMAENIEAAFMNPVLRKSWMTIAQHLQEMDPKELETLLTPAIAHELLGMGPAEVFADTVQGVAFKTYGISATLEKKKNFQSLTALLQTLASTPPFMEAFLQKYDMTKLLEVIIEALDVPKYQIEADQPAGQAAAAPAQPGAPGQVPQNNQGPDMQSQIPQAGAQSAQPGNPVQSNAQPGPPQGAVPATQFPGSRATGGLNG